MADKDITIGLQTVGADAAAREIDKMPDAIDQIPESVEPAVDEIERMGEALETIGNTAPDAADGLGEIDKNVRKISELQKAQVISQLGEVISQMAPQFAAAADAVRGFDSELADTLEKTSEIASRAGEAASTIATGFAAGGPAGAALAAAYVAVKNLAGVWVEMKEAQAAAEAAAAAADAYPLYLQKRRQFLADNAADISRLQTIREENGALAAQEDSFRRLIALRNELNNEAASAAQKEVQLAKLKGGDVALAEANAIAAELKAGVEQLQGNIAASSNAVNAAINLEKEAVTRLRIEQNKVAEGLKTAEQAGIEDLKAAAEDADQNTKTAQKNLADILGTADEKLANVVRDGEIALESKEKEYEGKTSAAAKQAFDQVDASLRETLAQAPAITQQAIDQISTDFSSVSQAATGKAAEVQQGLSTERAGTVQAIEKLAPTPQDTQAITNAVQQVGKAIQDQGNATISALGAVAAGIGQVTNAIARQQSQINQLFARIR